MAGRRFAVTRSDRRGCTWAYGGLTEEGERVELRVVDAAGPAAAAVAEPTDVLRLRWTRYRDVMELHALSAGTAAILAAAPWRRVAGADGPGSFDRRCRPPAAALTPTGVENLRPTGATLSFSGDFVRTGPTHWEGRGTAKDLGPGRMTIDGRVVSRTPHAQPHDFHPTRQPWHPARLLDHDHLASPPRSLRMGRPGPDHGDLVAVAPVPRPLRRHRRRHLHLRARSDARRLRLIPRAARPPALTARRRLLRPSRRAGLMAPPPRLGAATHPPNATRNEPFKGPREGLRSKSVGAKRTSLSRRRYMRQPRLEPTAPPRNAGSSSGPAVLSAANGSKCRMGGGGARPPPPRRGAVRPGLWPGPPCRGLPVRRHEGLARTA